MMTVKPNLNLTVHAEVNAILNAAKNGAVNSRFHICM